MALGGHLRAWGQFGGRSRDALGKMRGRRGRGGNVRALLQVRAAVKMKREKEKETLEVRIGATRGG